MKLVKLPEIVNFFLLLLNQTIQLNIPVLIVSQTDNCILLLSVNLLIIFSVKILEPVLRKITYLQFGDFNVFQRCR